LNLSAKTFEGVPDAVLLLMERIEESSLPAFPIDGDNDKDVKPWSRVDGIEALNFE
jgi:hypothetical protein